MTVSPNLTPDNKVAKPLLWIGIASIVMFFAALTSAYIVSFNAGGWIKFELPTVFFVSTAIIVLSSITMLWSLWAVKKNNIKHLTFGLFLTLGLGIAFSICQFMGWQDLFQQEVVFSGPRSNAAGSFFYILTSLHLVHLLAGMIALIITLIKSLLRKYSNNRFLGVQLCSTYWHFLTILWVYLLLFLIYIR